MLFCPGKTASCTTGFRLRPIVPDIRPVNGQITNYRLRITDNRLRITNHVLLPEFPQLG